MSRRNKPANRFGCKPEGDVCVAHDSPLVCPHGCDSAEPHKCSHEEPEFALARVYLEDFDYPTNAGKHEATRQLALAIALVANKWVEDNCAF